MKRELTYALCAAFVLGLASGCSSQGPANQNAGNGTAGPVGTIDVALNAAPDVTLDAVTYVITGPNSFSKSGNIDESHSSTIAATIGGLPAGNGFSITLTATSTDGATSCGGSASFDVTAATTTPVSVHLVCHGAAHTGSVLVNGSVNVCPQIDGVGASPAEVLVGGSIALTSSAHDADAAPSPLAYSWTATTGTIVNPNAANTRFVCTAPGSASITLGVSDGDAAPGCADSNTVTVNCTAQVPATQCALGNGAGPVKHVIYLQFDNTHLTRDRSNVPSDLEQMPHLLGFIRGNGTMMANDHTVLISHTAGGILSTLTGVYPDRHGQIVSNSFVRTSSTGTFSFPSSFGYWTDPVASGTSVPNMVAPDGSNFPAPWVAYTRAGCDVGGVGSANMVLENTGTGTNGDVFKVFGTGSSQFNEAVASNGASSGSAARALAQTDFVGFAIHCAQGSATCAGGQDDLLPGEPGGYAGFKGLFGAQSIDPLLTGQDATHPLTSLLGNPITDPFGQPGFPGFDGMEAEVSLAYVAAMQEHGVPVTYAYISDAHDFHGVAGNAHTAYGPGDPGYVAQLKSYDQAFDAFFTNLAAHGIDKSNTIFIITVDEGDHFVGSQPSNNATCDGVNVGCTWPTNTVGEINSNIDTLVTHQFPTLAAKFLGSGPNAFTVHGDDAPPFYLAKKGTGGGPLGQTDPDTRDFERQIAGLTAVNPYTGVTEPMLAQMVDQAGAKALHMYTTGDPLRNGTFTFFGDADYFITDFPTSTCETCINPAFAWNHGDIQSEIGQTWIGLVGPGVASQADQTVFTDHTDVRQTINALTGLPDSYEGDGRVITQALVPAAVPAALASDKATAEALGDAYKKITAPFGQFAADVIITSTKALRSNDAGDATYTSKEASIASLTAQRDALVAQIRDAFDLANYAGTPIDATQAAGWISQAQALLASADALAAAP